MKAGNSKQSRVYTITTKKQKISKVKINTREREAARPASESARLMVVVDLNNTRHFTETLKICQLEYLKIICYFRCKAEVD